jgi:RimJ/RimL family protein N-acetyltransferase
LSHNYLFGFDEQLARWACDRIPWADYQPTMKAVGIADGDTEASKLLAVCVYHSYIPTKTIDGKPWFGLCEISFAAASPKWATRSAISFLLGIPFLQYNCRKVVTIIPSTNKRALRFNEGIGLKPEGTLRHHFAKGVHACIHGILRSEYDARWKHPHRRRPSGSQAHGQIDAASAASA